MNSRIDPPIDQTTGNIRGIDPANAGLESVVEGNEDSRVNSGMSTVQVSGQNSLMTSPRGDLLAR